MESDENSDEQIKTTPKLVDTTAFPPLPTSSGEKYEERRKRRREGRGRKAQADTMPVVWTHCSKKRLVHWSLFPIGCQRKIGQFSSGYRTKRNTSWSN